MNTFNSYLEKYINMQGFHAETPWKLSKTYFRMSPSSELQYGTTRDVPKAFPCFSKFLVLVHRWSMHVLPPRFML